MPASPVRSLLRPLALAALLSAATACSGGSDAPPAGKTDAEYKQEIVAQMHAALLTDLEALHLHAKEMQAAAPSTKARGWDKAADAAAITAMQTAWLGARDAYEHVEGALAPIFPDLDAAIDERYDGFLEGLVGKGDDDLFDDKGVIGMHAAERILFLESTPANVVAFEKSLPGYKAAAWPATELEAASFKDKLLVKLVADTKTLRDQWQPAKIDIGTAYQGLIGLVNEQREKVNKASEGSEESRYSQRTMRDLRNNLLGTKKIYALFSPWLRSKPNGPAVDDAIVAGFAKLDAAYATVSGEAIPAPPATWSAEAPSATDLATPFGKLWTVVREAVDPLKAGSVVERMNAAAKIFGFPTFVEGT